MNKCNSFFFFIEISSIYQLIIIRDEKGELIDFGSACLAELLALRKGIQMRLDLNLHNVCVESDNCEILVNWFDGIEEISEWRCISMLNEIKSLCFLLLYLCFLVFGSVLMLF